MSEQTAIKKEVVKKTPKKTSSSANEASLNLEELRELAKFVDEHGFTEFEVENEKIRVRLSKQVNAPQVVHAIQPVASTTVAGTQAVSSVPKVETPHPGAKAETAASADEDLHKITSPIVGTFYRSPSPDKPPYCKEGDNVSFDTIVCIVEAMKLMNEIPAEVSGEVVKVYVENGSPVEFGQPLFGIKK